jgi:hypothetical protein
MYIYESCKKYKDLTENYRIIVYRYNSTMNDVPILPNPFKLLDMQRDKQSNIEKCTSCDNNDDDSSDEEETKFVEGLEVNDPRMKVWVVVVFSIGVTVLGIIIWLSAWLASNVWKNQDMIDFIKYINNNETGRKEAYQSILKSVNRLSNLMILFIAGFSIGLGIVVSDNKAASSIIIGGISLFVMGLPQLATYFENTIGYFLIYPFLDLKVWMKSDNFDKMTNEDFNNGSIASINFNPLITLFSLENLPEAFEKMRFGTDVNERSRQDFFVALDNDKDNLKEKGDFFKYLFDYTLKKNIIGKCAWIGLASSIAFMV